MKILLPLLLICNVMELATHIHLSLYTYVLLKYVVTYCNSNSAW